MTTLIPEENGTVAATAASKKRKPNTKARVASRRANVAPAQAKSARKAKPSMPVLDTNLPAGNIGLPTTAGENIGMLLLRRAALADDAYREDCCKGCHSAELKPVWRGFDGGSDLLCSNCGDSWGVEEASHLADAVACFDDPYRKIEPHDLAALVEHAATLHMQLRELEETLHEERESTRVALESRTCVCARQKAS